jgi:hypothetical protein
MLICGACEIGAPGFVGVGFDVVGVGGAPLACCAIRSAWTATEFMRNCFSCRCISKTMSCIMLYKQSSMMEGI